MFKPHENACCIKFRQLHANILDMGKFRQLIDLASPLSIGTVECRNRVLLAPMSGVSDVAFRKMAWKLGAGLVFSEMVASEALVCGKSEMAIRAQSGELPIHAVQLAGRQAKWMDLAARMARDMGADLIDINMGCPSRRVTSGLSGSALMRDLDNAMTLIDAVVGAVDVPVTLKMRLGWDEHTINAPELARRAQDSGVAMVSVHGRTRCQFYKGEADWNAVNAVCDAVDIPVVVNGDIANHSQAQSAMQQSGADAVMIGRASYGAPWLAGQIANASSLEMTLPEICELVLEHFELSLIFHGQEMGMRHFRKHLGWYLDGLGRDVLSGQMRGTIMTSKNPTYIRKTINLAFQNKLENAA